MNTAWQKAIRDLWQERMRTALVVLAIALGLAGFASVLSAYAVLTRELDKGYLATDPASIVLQTDAVDDRLVAALRADPAVSNAEPRRVVTGQIKVGPVEWRRLILFVVKDYGQIRVSKLEPQEGAWPPATGEMLIERDAFQVAHTRIGETVTVKMATGPETALLVSGSVHDVGQAQARMERLVYGYVTTETLAKLGEKPFLDQVNILVAADRSNEAHIAQVADRIKQITEAQGHPVRRLDLPRPGKHPHSELMGALMLAMSTFGIFVLILSGILVVNLLMALMAAQVRQIGVMKAIGGNRWQIARIYFGQALLLGVAAVLVSLPLSILGGRLLCRYMAVFLNFNITSFAVPVWVYLLVAVVGIVATLLSAAYPVWKGSSIPVREALADFGVSEVTFGANRIDRLLAKTGGNYRLVMLAIRNGYRRPTRLALTVLTLAAGGIFFMSALNIRASMINTLDHLFASKKYDLSVALRDMYPLDKIDRAVRNTEGVTRAETWFVTKGAWSQTNAASSPADVPGAKHEGSPEPAQSNFTVFALPPDTQMLELEIVEGRDLVPGDTDAMVVNNALAGRGPNLKVGDIVTMRLGTEIGSWRVVGIARDPFSPPAVYIPRGFLDRKHPGQANLIQLALDRSDAESIAAVKTDLDLNLKAEGLPAEGGLSKADSRISFDEHMLMIYVFLIVMSGIIGCVGGLGLMTTMSLNVLERRREMGVLRAIGATPAQVWVIVTTEGVAIGLLSWLLAGLAAWPISLVVGNVFVRLIFRSGLDFIVAPAGILTWLGITVSLSVLASFLPAWRAARYSVREALNYE